MHRRTFLRVGVAAAVAGLPAAARAASGHPKAAPLAPAPFRLDYAPHFGMFEQHAGRDPVAQLEFMAAEGFRALEDNGMRERPVAEQERIGRTLGRLGMRMGVFVGHRIDWRTGELPALPSGDPAGRDAFLAQLRESVEVAKRVNARWMTVVPGMLDPRLDLEYQTAHVVDALRRGAEVLAPHDLVMVLEPLNTRVDHPGVFLTRAAQAYQLCRAVGSPACKVLFDVYHQQITEGQLIANLDRCWDEVAYVQAGDVPGRREPGTGEINYGNVFRHLHARGYRGVVGMEHGNARPGRAGERAVIEAYRRADTFAAAG